MVRIRLTVVKKPCSMYGCSAVARRVFANEQRDAAMRIDMIGAVLRVVFHDENRGVLPVRTVRHRVHDAAHCQIVVGHGSGSAWKARPRAPV